MGEVIVLRRSVNFTSSDSFDRYCVQVKPFCPYLSPAEAEQVLFVSYANLQSHPEDVYSIQREIFYICLKVTEEIRIKRRALGGRKGFLLCENIIFDLQQVPKSPDNIFGWPHWLLKCLYSNFGLMFGKFWIGEKDTSRDGKPIPEPTFNFISIRSAVKSRDPYFLDATPGVLDRLINSIDSEENVHATLGFRDFQIRSLAEMMESEYYDYLVNWSKQFLP